MERVSRDLHEAGRIVRFKVDGEFFFANLLQFEAPDELDGQLKDIKADVDVFLGAHRLDDGSFWLRWLRAPGSLELIPKSREETVRAAWE